MINAANHEEWGDRQIIKWRFFALTLVASAAIEICIFRLHPGHGQALAFALLTAALYQLSADKLFKCCAGVPVDEKAWEEFFRRYQRDIRTAIYRVIGFPANGRYSYLFADVMQRVNLRLLENGRRAMLSFRGKTDLEAKAFLRKVAASVAVNSIHQEEATQASSLETASSSQEEGRSIAPTDPSAPNEDYLLLLNTIERCLQEVIRGKNKSRNMLIFKLAVIDGLSPKEIADIPSLGLSSSHAVEQQITRIRYALRACIEKQ